jgi:hypothetical protein
VGFVGTSAKVQNGSNTTVFGWRSSVSPGPRTALGAALADEVLTQNIALSHVES